MTDLRAECLAMADWLDMLAFSIPKLFQTVALLRRIADALPQEPKGDVFEVVARAISDASFFSTDTERAARAALSAAEPFIQERIREAVEADGWRDISTAPHNQSVLLGWQDWRDGRWCMEVNAATTGERLGNGYSNRSLHGSATHWRPLPPAPPAIRQQPEEDGE